MMVNTTGTSFVDAPLLIGRQPKTTSLPLRDCDFFCKVKGLVRFVQI